MDPKTAFSRAKSALATGKTETARLLFRQILETHPKSAETHFQLGRIELHLGKAKKARKHLMAALKLRPQEGAVWMSLMDAEIALKNSREIGRLLRAAKAARLKPDILKQLSNKAMTGNRQGVARLSGVSPEEFERARAAYMAGRFKEAEALAAKLVKAHPKSAPLHTIRAASLARTGELALAKHSYEKAISLDPEYFEARLQFGQLLTGMGDYPAASAQLTKAHEMAKDSPHVNLSLGILLSILKNDQQAIEYLEKARESLPAEPRLQLYLAQSYQGLARADEARAALALARKHPMQPAEQVVLIKTLSEMGEEDEACRILDRLLAKHPDSTEILTTAVNLRTNTGDFEGMRRAVRRLVELGTASGVQLLAYSRGGKIAKDDPVMRAMEKAYSSDSEQEETRTDLAFALAKVYDDWGDYRKSFRFLRKANDNMRRLTPPDAESSLLRFRVAKNIFASSAASWGKAADAGNGAAPPRSIQITGMPRSGTTLVEQIIASHSQVTAAGELGIVEREADSILEPADIEGRPLLPEELEAFGTAITNSYARLFPGADIVTDKAIMSNVFAGIFAAALPVGRMVVLRRDPRDNCLSIYKNKFKLGSHSYSTDLKALAHQYLHFLEIQAYWREQAPGSFYELRYEDLIANPEEESRALIDYCGLDWEDACLEFYKNTRQIRTLSAFQVRQPIYSSSVAAWKHYEDELQPLIKILDKGGALEGY